MTVAAWRRRLPDAVDKGRALTRAPTRLRCCGMVSHHWPPRVWPKGKSHPSSHYAEEGRHLPGTGTSTRKSGRAGRPRRAATTTAQTVPGKRTLPIAPMHHSTKTPFLPTSKRGTVSIGNGSLSEHTSPGVRLPLADHPSRTSSHSPTRLLQRALNLPAPPPFVPYNHPGLPA